MSSGVSFIVSPLALRGPSPRDRRRLVSGSLVRRALREFLGALGRRVHGERRRRRRDRAPRAPRRRRPSCRPASPPTRSRVRVALAGDDRRGAVHAGDGEPRGDVRVEPARHAGARRSRAPAWRACPACSRRRPWPSRSALRRARRRRRPARTAPRTACSPSPSVPGTNRNTPRPSAAATLGMTRATRAPAGSAARQSASDTPAATETSGRSPSSGADLGEQPRTCCGRTATIDEVRPSTSSASEEAASSGRRAVSRRQRRRTRAGDVEDRDGSSPAERAAMCPAPMTPTLGQGSGDVAGADEPTFTRGPASELIEEALLDEPRPLLGRDLDVARREQEDLLARPAACRRRARR